MSDLEFFISSSVLILFVILLRFLFRNKINRRLQYALWILVVLRLLVPVQFGQLSFGTSAVVSRMEREVTYRSSTSYEAVHVQAEEEPEILGTEEGYILIYEDVQSVLRNGTQKIYAWKKLPWTAVWHCGMVTVALWFTLSNLRFYKKATKELAALLVENCPVPVYISQGVASPCLVGLFRQKILLPPEAAQEPERLKHIIAHELTHRRHGDLIWGLLRCALLCAYWYHPLVWCAAILSKKDCELACDEGAIARLGEEERIPYGETLLKMVSLSSVSRGVGRVATTMAESKKQLAQRILCIAKRRKFRVIAVVGVLCLLLGAIPVVFAGKVASMENSYYYEYVIGEKTVELLPKPQAYEGEIYEAYQKAIEETSNVLDYSLADLNEDGIYELILRRFNHNTIDLVFYTYGDGVAIPLSFDLSDALLQYYGYEYNQFFDYDVSPVRNEKGEYYAEVNDFIKIGLELQEEEITAKLASAEGVCSEIPRAAARDLSLLAKVLRGIEYKKTFVLPWEELEIPDNWVERKRKDDGSLEYMPVLLARKELLRNGERFSLVNENAVQIPNVLLLDEGRLEAWDWGEFGGGVRYRDSSGNATTLISDNFVSYYVANGRTFVVTGLAHLGLSDGGFYEIYEENGTYQSKLLYPLPSAPYAVTTVGKYCFVMTDAGVYVFHGAQMERFTALHDGPMLYDTWCGSNMIYANGCLYVAWPGHIMEFNINEERSVWYVYSTNG